MGKEDIGHGLDTDLLQGKFAVGTGIDGGVCGLGGGAGDRYLGGYGRVGAERGVSTPR